MARRRSWVPRPEPVKPVDDGLFDEEWLDDREVDTPSPVPPPPGGPPLASPTPPRQDWKQHVALVGQSMQPAFVGAERPPREREILYFVDANRDVAQHGLTVEVFS